MTKYDESLIGQRLGIAIARDTLEHGTDRKWPGLNHNDLGNIPVGMSLREVEAVAKVAYLIEIARAGK